MWFWHSVGTPETPFKMQFSLWYVFPRRNGTITVYVHTSDILDRKNVIFTDLIQYGRLVRVQNVRSWKWPVQGNGQIRAMKNAKRICLTSDGFGIVNFNNFFDFPPPGSKINIRALLTNRLNLTTLFIWLFYPYMSNWKMNSISILIWSDHEKN